MIANAQAASPRERRGIISLLVLATTLTTLTVGAETARADGEPDNSFAGSSVVTTDFGDNLDQAIATAITPDGHIVVAGTTANDLAVWVLRADGVPESGFGPGGRVVVDVGGDETAVDVAIQPDGKIVVVGTRRQDGDVEVAVIRLLPNGDLDESFDADGRRVLDWGGDSSAAAVKIGLDGKIVIAGTRTNSTGSVLAVARLLSDGEFDITLDGNGKRTIDFGSDNDNNAEAADVAIQDDGKIVVVGTRTSPSEQDFIASRVLVDGSLDESFDSNGKVDVDLGGNDTAVAVVIRLGGRIVIAGTREGGGDRDFGVAVFLSDGSPDIAFDGNGKRTVDFGADETATDMVLQADQRVLVSGTRVGAGGTSLALARIDIFGFLDPTLDGDGKVRVELTDSSIDESAGVAVQTNGRVILGATTTTNGESDFAATRLLNTVRVATGVIEIPGNGASLSGIGLISGWVCTGTVISVSLDGGTPIRAASGTTRADTAGVCGDSDNGFAILFNWALLGDGLHVARAYADGSQFAVVIFSVTTLGVEFLAGAEGTFALGDFPDPGDSATIAWSQAQQNFRFVTFSPEGGAAAPEGPSGAVTGALEIPASGSSESGIGVISGWVCDALSVSISIDGGPPVAAAYGTPRGDTAGVCGDSDNGFGLLFNWGLLADGPHELVASADGMPFGTSNFTVTTLGEPFVRDASGTFELDDFPAAGQSVTVAWDEGQQNVVIIEFDD